MYCHSLTNQISIHFYDSIKYQNSVILILLVNAKCSVCWCYRNTAGMQPFIFWILVEQKAELLFLNYNMTAACCNSALLFGRRVELSCEGVSDAVSTLESLGGSTNGTEWRLCLQKTTEAQHRLACTMLMCSTRACVFNIISRPKYEASNFHVSCHEAQ